jgi:Lon protease-like protein
VTASSSDLGALPLFPLQTVLYPGGLLNLKVFEARYLDLVGRCLRERTPFGVVCLRQGSRDTHRPGEEPVKFESLGVLATLEGVDAEQAGILRVRCVGGQRFRIASPRQQADGLWLADVARVEDDEAVAPLPGFIATVKALANAIATLRSQGNEPFLSPYRFDDAGWVANRWCEILPISLAAKQKLMELPEPVIRLNLVGEYLRGKGVIPGR